jgi:hypothetical protein
MLLIVASLPRKLREAELFPNTKRREKAIEHSLGIVLAQNLAQRLQRPADVARQ